MRQYSIEKVIIAIQDNAASTHVRPNDLAFLKVVVAIVLDIRLIQSAQDSQYMYVSTVVFSAPYTSKLTAKFLNY